MLCFRNMKLFCLFVAVTIMSVVTYVFLPGIWNHNAQSFINPLESKVKNSLTQATTQGTLLPATIKAPTLSVSTKLPSPPATNQYSLSPDTGRQALLPGDSNLPYPSRTIETITKPPQSVFIEPDRASYDPSFKKILFWNDDYFDKHFGFGFGREPFLAAKCRVNTCFTTGDRTRFPIEEVDAVIWHMRSWDTSLPQQRSPHTRYVFWLMESPLYMLGDLHYYNNVFNWTFTYRLDSDFPRPYNKMFRRRQPLPPTNRNYAAGKTRLVAWFSTHCSTESGRITLVRTMQQYVPIDIFGACGPLACSKDDFHKCYSIVNATYKFYLSYENSLCQDYVTEKFFNILRWDVVPVVYGFGNYSVQAPPHSYIDALSFPSVKALTDYLLYLHQNDTAYNEYFRWKRFHQQMPVGWAVYSQHYCDMCERLHTDTSTKIYDMHKWYVEDAHCKTRYSPDISSFINSAPKMKTFSFAGHIVVLLISMLI